MDYLSYRENGRRRSEAKIRFAENRHENRCVWNGLTAVKERANQSENNRKYEGADKDPLADPAIVVVIRIAMVM